MSAFADEPADLRRRVAVATLAALDSYRDITAELVRLRDLTEAERLGGLIGLRQAARGLGVSLVVLARTIETAGGRRAVGADDPRQALPLVRALGDGLVMLDAPDWASLVSRPLPSPKEIERLAAAPGARRFLERHGGTRVGPAQ